MAGEDRDEHARIDDVGIEDSTDKIFDPTTRRVSKNAFAELIAQTRDFDDVGPTRTVRPLVPRMHDEAAVAAAVKASVEGAAFARELAVKRRQTIDAEGERFGSYTLFGAVGRGGMAEVRLAAEPCAGTGVRLCVVKRVPHGAPADHREALIEEGRVLRELRHPNIVELYAAGEIERRPYLAFELVDGVSLRELQRLSPGGLPLGAALEIGAQAADALAHAHSAIGSRGAPLCLVHRDVTPANILIERGGRVKLADFGIAKFTGRGLETRMGLVRGKLGYLSPEQMRGAGVEGRTDVFSLGLVLIELITGRRVLPQRMMVIAELEQAIREQLAGTSRVVPEEVVDYLVRMAALQVAVRPDAADVAVELRVLLATVQRMQPLPELLERNVFSRLMPIDVRSIVEAPTTRVRMTPVPADEDEDDPNGCASYATTMRVARALNRTGNTPG